MGASNENYKDYLWVDLEVAYAKFDCQRGESIFQEMLTLRFSTCLILLNEIEHVVKNTTNTWKNIYHLHKLSDFPISISDKDDDDDQEKDEEKDDEVTPFDNVDVEEIDLVKIVRAVIASLPHSPRKTLITSSM